MEVAFETTRKIVDMLYKVVFRRNPDITFIVAHGGGTVPLLEGWLKLLGTESWFSNPEWMAKEEVQTALSRLYVDTAVVGIASLLPALRLVGKDHVVYDLDRGAPCSTVATMKENKPYLRSLR
ncbi:hypothetical protein RBB50_005724 [Rhinocladiella similis]